LVVLLEVLWKSPVDGSSEREIFKTSQEGLASFIVKLAMRNASL